MATLLLLSTLVLLGNDDPSVNNWPGFLGAGAASVATENVPLEWAPDQNMAWKHELVGEGQSSPIVWNGQVYVTTVDGPMKDTNHVLAFDAKTGTAIWDYAFPTSLPVKNTLYVSRAAPTPAADANGLYVFFESGDLIALDHAGKLRWQRSLTKDFGTFENEFGIGSSLAQSGDALFVLADHKGPSYLLAVNKTDGKDRWKVERTSRVSWTSPALLHIAGRDQVIVSSDGALDGYDPADGKLLWTQGDLGGNAMTTPLLTADGTILVGATAGERGQYAAVAPKSNIAVRIVEKDGKLTTEKLWTADKALASFASPIVYQGLAYWVNQVGVVFCFDAATGEKKYNARLAETCWATPVGIGDRIYFFGKDGGTTVLAAGPEYKQLAVNRTWRVEDIKVAGDDPGAKMFGGPIQYGVAVAQNSFFVRTGNMLYCIRQAN